MTPPIRFLFDECCIGRCTVERELRQSLALFGAEAELAHVLNAFPMGTPDAEWMQQIAAEGGWIIISSDRGKSCRKSESLPLICRELRVTHVMLSAGIHKRSTYYRVQAITSCWEQLIATANAPPGTGFQISMRPGKDGLFSFRFHQNFTPPV